MQVYTVKLIILTKQSLLYKFLNPEGNLIKLLMKCISPEFQISLESFKQELSNHNGFFDGIRQQDAYECLVMLLDVY